MHAPSIALFSSWAHPPPLPLVAPGVGLSRGPLRSRAAHPAGATLTDSNRANSSSSDTPARPFPSLAYFLKLLLTHGRSSGQQKAAHPARFPSSRTQRPAAATGRRARKRHHAPIPKQQGRPASQKSAHRPRYLPSAGARKRPRLPAHPFFVAAVSGDAGLPAREKPAPGVPWSLLIPKTRPPQARPDILLLRPAVGG